MAGGSTKIKCFNNECTEGDSIPELVSESSSLPSLESDSLASYDDEDEDVDMEVGSVGDDSICSDSSL